MTLPQQLVDIQLQGLDTKTDAKLVVPGRMLELENARFEKTGRISKRVGSELVESTADTIKRIYGLRKTVYGIKSTGSTGETFQRRGNGSYGAADLGTMAAPMATAESVVGGFQPPMIGAAMNGEPSWMVDSARLDASTVVYVTVELAGVRVSWYDTTKSTVIASYQSNITNAAMARIMVIPQVSKIFVGIQTTATNTIAFYEFTTSSATLRSSAATLYTTDPSSCWDWCATADGAAVYVGYVDGSVGSARLRILKIDTSSWVSTLSTGWNASAAVTAIGMAAYATIRIFWSDGTSGLSTRTYNTSLTATLTSTVVVAATDARYLIAVDLDTSENAYVAWNVTATVSGSRSVSSIRYAQVNTSGVPGSVVTTRGAGLASKIYRYNHGGTMRVFVLGALGISSNIGTNAIEDEQRGYVFLEVSATRAMRARLLYFSAGIAPATVSNTALSLSLHGLLPNLYQIGSDSAIFGGAGTTFDSTLYYTNNTTLRLPTGRLLKCNMNPSYGYFGVEQDGCLIISGGVLHMFDGQTARECGFVTYPTITSLAQSAGTGACADGTYSVVATYERLDARGRVIESAVSPPKSITISGGGGTAGITVTVTPYRLGLSTGQFERIVVYRTSKGGTVYQRDVIAVNSPSSDEQTINITSSDGNLASSALLYTDGGEGDHTQPSSPIAICADKDRLFVIAGDNPYQVLPSKPLGAGEGPKFYDELFRTVSSEDGPLTALARLNGKLFAFKTRQVFAAPGDGPDAAGLNDTLGDLELLHQDVGANDQRSVLMIESGIMARGQKGLWLVGRDLGRSYVGQDIDDYNFLPFLDATYAADRNEARFLVYDSASGTNHELVFNDFFGAWSVNKSFGAACAAVIDGARHFVSDTAKGASVAGIFRERFATESASAIYTDAHRTPTDVILRFVTSWLKFGNLQGFVRAYELYFVGDMKTTHTLQVRVRYNYVNTWSETHQITSANATAGSSAYQFAVPMQTQKCQAFGVEVMDISPGGEGFDLSGMAALVGIMSGPYRMRIEKFG